MYKVIFDYLIYLPKIKNKYYYFSFM